MIPLFEKYPTLQEKLPYVSLCELPTPILHLTRIGEQLGIKHLYLKQDGLTSKHYGGNKIRKLEFLLGEAKQKGSKKVMTFGYSGSNHATATAIHANVLGMKSISMLVSQKNADYVRKNLLLSYTGNAEIHHYKNRNERASGEKLQKLKHLILDRKPVYTIPLGGSSPPGITGFVNAAFELKSQIDNNLMPEPDLIYIALGSAGTAVGLFLGVKLLGVKTNIVPVRVIEPEITGEERIRSAFDDTIAFLRNHDPSIPLLPFSMDDFPVRNEFLGDGYGKFTEEGIHAIHLLGEMEGIQLDGTYTGKAMAALLQDAVSGLLKNKTVLFWNTLNAHDFSEEIKDIDYRMLPKKVHWFFETEIQDPSGSS